MPAPAPFSTSTSQPLPYPALYLYPLNDSFVPKHIALAHGQHVKIGRQTNAKTAPGERNGYFDSKVLSRQHAEVWEDGGKIFIKDVKSSNGTFINGERLSSEAVESDPHELKSDDIVEYGIDIVGEDNKTIIHHKVAARVLCIFTEQDAQVAARAEQYHQQQQQQYQQQAAASNLVGQPGPSGVGGAPSGFNFNNTQQRRPQQHQQPSLGSLGGMGGRPPAKTGLSFDVILSRLQGELQKSRETGAELNTLTGAINDIHDTLSGGLPTNLPPYPSLLPLVRPSQDISPPPPALATAHQEQSPLPPSATPTAAITALQTQLRDTQNTLASQLDKIRALEAVLAEQEVVKRDVKILREMMETRQRGMEQEAVGGQQLSALVGHEPRGGFDLEEEDEGDEEMDPHDDDDTRSVNTVVPHELERVEEEDEEQMEQEEERLSMNRGEVYEQERREVELEEAAREEMERRSATDPGRPHTPEPIRVDIRAESYGAQNLSAPSVLSQSVTAEKVSLASDNMHERIVQLSAQVTAVMALTSALEAQHTAAQSTIKALESKVETLEALLKTTNQQQAPAPPPLEQQPESSDRITDWMKNVEGKWNTVQEEWNQERERLGKAREEWESKVKQVDSGLERMRTAAAAAVSSSQGYQEYQSVGNGDVLKHNGLVTPPSPRSQSSDSVRYRRRRRGLRGRSGSGSGSTDDDEEEENDDDVEKRTRRRRSLKEMVSIIVNEQEETPVAVGESKPNNDDNSDSPAPTSASSSSAVVTGAAVAIAAGGAQKQKSKGMSSIVTPESSMYKPSSPEFNVHEDVESEHGEVVSEQSTQLDKGMEGESARERNFINVQTAVGVLLLSVAAAAVIWKVKPE